METTDQDKRPPAKQTGAYPEISDKTAYPGASGAEDETRLGTTLAALVFSLLATVVFAAVLLLAVSLMIAAVASAQEPGDPGNPGSGRSSTQIAYDQAELDMVALINEYREANDLEPLLVSDAASLATKRHSQDMARFGYMDHDTQRSAYFPDGTTFDERLDESGYDYDVARSENIAAGSDAQDVFERWRDSQGHEANMLDPEMEVIGVGASGSENGDYDTYWTTDFGAHTDDSARPVDQIAADEEGSTAEPRASEGTSSAQPPDEGTESLDGPDRHNGGTTVPTTGSAPTDDQYASEEGGSDGEAGQDTEEQEPGGQPGGQPSEENNEPGPPQPAPDQEQGDAPEQGEDCDTLAGFDLTPFDSGFGEELSKRIRAKVDCKLEQHGADDGTEGPAGGDGESQTTTITTTSDSDQQNQQIITTETVEKSAEDQSERGGSGSGANGADGADNPDAGTEEPTAEKPSGEQRPAAETPDSNGGGDKPPASTVPSAPDKGGELGEQDNDTRNQDASGPSGQEDNAPEAEEAESSGTGSWTLIEPASTGGAASSDEPGRGQSKADDNEDNPDSGDPPPKLALEDDQNDGGEK